MPYTFGGGTGDDITFGTVTGMGFAGGIGFACGWWRPTTLTATRGLWSFGNTVGAEIDATTDELRLRTDNGTDGEWTTSGVDLAVDEWKFIAFVLSATNTGSAGAWRVWAGTVETAPVEVTVSVDVATSGNFTGNNTGYIGNKGSGTLAFQGDIADFTAVTSNPSAGSTTHPFGIAAYGTITDAEALHLYETMVLPAWLGKIDVIVNRPAVGAYNVYHCGLDVGALVVGGPRANATIGPVVPTINGATWSENGAPRPNPGPDMLPFRRR